MGPINDKLGVEQGGVISDRIYKLSNNTQLSSAQNSGLGVDLGSSVVSSIGFVDDTGHLSDSLPKLADLLHLTEEYCRKYHVELVPDKTKLLVFAPNKQSLDLYLHKLQNPIIMGGKALEFASSAEHVGILRSPDASADFLSASIRKVILSTSS